MSLDLNKIGLLIDEILADETQESFDLWLNKRRQNAKALIKNDVIETLKCTHSWKFNIDHTEKRCVKCGLWAKT